MDVQNKAPRVRHQNIWLEVLLDICLHAKQGKYLNVKKGRKEERKKNKYLGVYSRPIWISKDI